MILSVGVGEFFAEFQRAFGEGEAFIGDVLAVFGHFLSVKVHLDFVIAIFGAGWEVREALESEELGGSVVVLENAFVGGFQDGVVNFFREIGFFADGDRFEFGEGEFLAGFEFAVDFGDGVFTGEKDLERLVRDGEAEPFGAWLGYPLADMVVVIMVKPLSDLVDFLFGEGGEGTLFSHKS